MSDIELAVNCDGVGGCGGVTALSFFNFDGISEADVLRRAAGIGRFEMAAPWYESDHALFWPRGYRQSPQQAAIPIVSIDSSTPSVISRGLSM